ncbi:DUF2786 domain-containing protein [Corynebacterium cystitidis]|uniref:DUF2786 domain-containing protein n=1 Tax=Corynebacterium cystitidis TaxID=35757 RepID=UPI00211EBAF8|nr:DUF2786 domain-containing protein [Corynebacterium cystitidis]
MNTNSIDKIKQRVQKLLNQAADRSGTPEGDVFYSKAFDLMATYGFDERDLSQADDGDAIAMEEIELSGAYTDMQALLLSALAVALHCEALSVGVRNSTKVEKVMVFGLRRHVKRLVLLFSMLMPQMVAKGLDQPAQPGYSTVVLRRSFMSGFASQVAARLTEAEETVAAASAGYELALIDDATRATEARDNYLEDNNLRATSKQSQRAMNATAYYNGMDAGDLSDLGQTRLRQRPALPS